MTISPCHINNISEKWQKDLIPHLTHFLFSETSWPSLPQNTFSGKPALPPIAHLLILSPNDNSPSPTPAQDEWKNYPDPNLFTAWCIWYEFQWGITSPPRILDRRRELLRKVQDQEPLAPLEALWYQLIIIDTDLF